jgi:TRAP-type uncharacterized transport system fused permease subunit
MIKVNIAPIVAHLFVFYYATLSVITPPVCIAVFVAAGIAETEWTQTARYALSFGAVTYVIPFLFIIYPGMLAQAGVEGFCRAAFSGCLFVLSFANLFGGMKISGNRIFDKLLWLIVAVLAVLPGLCDHRRPVRNKKKAEGAIPESSSVRHEYSILTQKARL